MAKILLADDVQACAERERSFLNRIGSLLLTAGSNEAEILAQARAHHPDLIFLRSRQSGLDGPSCCRAIKADEGLRRTPVVLLANAIDNLRCLAAGGDGVLVRPLTPRRFLEIVRRFVSVPERVHDRAAVAIRVNYSRGEDEGIGFTRDIGAGGLFLHTHERCRIGDRLDLSFRLPTRNEPIRTTGSVARAVEAERSWTAGVGVRFDALAARDRIEIARFVREHGGEAH